MALPPRPAPLTSDPRGKPGIPDHLVENVRRAAALAGAEYELTRRIQLVVDRMEAAPGAIAGGWYR